jgi:hypothetical protein
MKQAADALLVATFVGVLLALVVVLGGFALLRRQDRRLSRPASLTTDQLVGLLFALVAPFGPLFFGAANISHALGGYWPAGDFRSSNLFVNLNWAVILLLTPLVSLFGVWILWSNRPRR